MTDPTPREIAEKTADEFRLWREARIGIVIDADEVNDGYDSLARQIEAALTAYGETRYAEGAEAVLRELRGYRFSVGIGESEIRADGLFVQIADDIASRATPTPPDGATEDTRK